MSTVGDVRSMLTPPQLPPGMALGGPAPEPVVGAGLGPGDIWRIVRQRKLMILITTVIIYALVVAATFAVWRFAPAFPSEAYVQLVPPVEGLAVISETFAPKEYIERQLATEAARMTEPQLLMEVLALPEVKDTSFYRWYGDNFEKCLKELRDLLVVSPVRDTNLVRVAIALKSPREATLIVNSVIDRHLARSRDTVADEGRRRLDTLKNTRADVVKELTEIRQRIAAKRAQRDMPALESDRQVQVEVITMLNNTLAELQTREVDMETQLQNVRGFDPRMLPVTAEERVIVEADPVLRYYRQQVEAIEIQIEAIRVAMIGENHRQMLMLRAQRDNYFQKEGARREELTQDLRSRKVESLQQELARVRTMKMQMREQLAERENAQRDLDQAIQELQGWTKDEERLARELEQVGMALREAETQLVARSREGRLTRASLARDAVMPSRPNLPAFLGGGALLAIIGGVGLAFLRELTDQAIRTPLDVTRHGHLSVLGTVPLLDDEEADVADIEHATRLAPQSVTADAFRQIRAHLIFSGPRETQRVLLLTSPRPDDGKTAVAINLAVAFAQGGERVLLIDGNFRRPAVRKAFQGIKTEGLSNVLIGRARLENVVTKTDVPNLDVLGSGPMPPNPAELLGSPAMRELLEAARGRYDRVLIDGPPCLLISDALIVATQAEGVVVVARAVRGTKGTLRRARDQLTRIGARVIGAVLNGVKTRPGGYLRQQYREFYDYTDEEVVVRELSESASAREALAMLEGDRKGEKGKDEKDK